jgi:hypothetical protein
VLLAVLGSVDTHHRVLVVEEVLGERLGEEGLTGSRGTDEEERGDGTLLVRETGAVEADGVGDGGDGFFLTDDGLVKGLLHLEKLLTLRLLHVADRDAAPLSDNLLDGFGSNRVAGESLPSGGPHLPLLGLLLLLESLKAGLELGDSVVTEVGGGGEAVAGGSKGQ